MRRITTLAATLALALAAAGGAVASGGLDSGGSGGGGSTGGGGGGGGGGSILCSPLVNYSATSGYVPYGAGTAAVWVAFTLKGCSSSLYTVHLLEHDVSGATFDYDQSLVLSSSGKGFSFTYDNEPLPNDTTYEVTFTVTDAVGNVVDMRSSLLTTPKPRVA